MTALSPNTGPDGGGQQVTVTGRNLAGATAVSFGDFGQGQNIRVALDGHSLTVDTPPAWWGDGPVFVQVTTPHGVSAVIGTWSRYTYQPGPAVTAPPCPAPSDSGCPSGTGSGTAPSPSGSSGSATGNPAVVPTAGSLSPTSAAPGQKVSLSGTATAGTVLTVLLECIGCAPEGTEVGTATVGGDGHYNLQFTVPRSAEAGAASVVAGCDSCGDGWTTFTGLTITQPAGSSTTTAGPSPAAGSGSPSQAGPPKVTSLSPDSGPDGGEQVVTSYGSGLNGATSVYFGDFGQARIVKSAADGSWLEVDTPEAWWGVGPVYVEVTTPAGTSTLTSASKYTYTP